MGSVATMERIDRFREEFEQDICAKVTLKIGDALMVKDITVSDVSGEAWVVVIVEDPAGQTHELNLAMVFDPDFSDRSEMVERLSEDYGLDPDDVRKRFKDADLF